MAGQIVAAHEKVADTVEVQQYAPAQRPVSTSSSAQGPKRNYIKPVDAPFGRRGFGMKKDPFTGQSRMHRGQDFPGKFGTSVVAAKDGVVELVSDGCASWSKNKGQRACGGGFGNFVRIRHADGNFTYYGHMQNSKLCPALSKLKAGQNVTQGQAIGCIGSSGNSTGPHMHFEVRAGGRGKNNAVDPKLFLRYGSKE